MSGNGSPQQRLNLIVGRRREQDRLRDLLRQSLNGVSTSHWLAAKLGSASRRSSSTVPRREEKGCLVLAGGCYDLERPRLMVPGRDHSDLPG